MIEILDSEVESFKRHAEKKGLYKDAPEEFYKQIGLILVALKLLRKVHGIHTKKKELEKFIFEHVTVAWLSLIHISRQKPSHRNTKNPCRK